MNCPVCNSQGRPVPYGTVKSLVMCPVKPLTFHLCLGQSCSVAYFSESGEILPVTSLSVPIWYKKSDNFVHICYCAELTRGEIINAVKLGYTTIQEIRLLTGKTTTGNCRTTNPSGTCCHQAFQELIDETKSFI